MFSLNKDKRGFTLIEVMVVLVILGVLAAISVPMYSNYVRKAKVNEAVSNIGAAANAMRIFRMEQGRWPADAEDDKSKEELAKLNVNVDQYYFSISWTSDANGLKLKADKKNFDDEGTIEYTIDNDYKGTWSGDLVTKYADYLTQK